MAYSITTKDGITINNIPDDVPPDSQELKDRVAAIRAGQTERPTQPPASKKEWVSVGLKKARHITPIRQVSNRPKFTEPLSSLQMQRRKAKPE